MKNKEKRERRKIKTAANKCRKPLTHQHICNEYQKYRKERKTQKNIFEEIIVEFQYDENVSITHLRDSTNAK